MELPDPGELEGYLEGLGISDDSRLVVYWSDEWVGAATRTVFTLEWAGLGDRTVLLDGGLEGWRAAGLRTLSAHPELSRGSLTLRPRHDRVVDAEWMQQNARSDPYTVLDARSQTFYDGERADRGKSGHIGGALSLHWERLMEQVGAANALRDEDALRDIFTEVGVDEDDTVVVYRHIGQYATTVLFAARTLGYDVRLYDGSWQDWAARDLPTILRRRALTEDPYMMRRVAANR